MRNGAMAVVPFGLVCLLACSGSAGAPPPTDLPQAALEYLGSHHQSLTVDSTALTLLDASLEGKTVFLAGEVHGIATDQALDPVFLRYVQVKLGVRTYVAEFGYSFGYFVNRYLATGDEAPLLQAFDAARGSLAWTKEYVGRWRALYQLNSTLPPGQAIEVLGIDLEWQPTLAFLHLRALLPPQPPPAEISIHLGTLASMPYGSATFSALLAELDADLTAHDAAYRAHLGDRHLEFAHVVRNTLAARANASIEGFAAREDQRDRLMYENFVKLAVRAPAGAYYSEMGSLHVIQGRGQGVKPFAAWLNRDAASPVRGKVVSVVYVHRGCTLMTPYPYGSAPFHDEDAPAAILARAAPSRSSQVTLFALDGPGSPFSSGLHLVLGPDDGGVTTDYFQLVALIEDSGPTTPLDR